MKTNSQAGRRGPGVANGHTDIPDGDAEGRHHRERARLEQEVAELSAINAELIRVNRNLAEAQSWFQAILENFSDPIYVKDTQSRYLKINRAFAKRLGVADPEEAVGKTDFDFQLAARAKEIYEDEQRIMRAGEALLYKPERQVLANGEAVWTSTTKMPLRDAEGKIIGLVGINRDITAIKEAEDAVQRKEEKLQASAGQLDRNNQELQEFAYVASHDLQEPLRKIVVFGERLKEKNADKFDDSSKEYLERMQKAAGRMQTLINDLLAYSRVTTKAQAFAPVNLAETAAGAVNELKGQMEAAKGRVEVGALPVIEAEPFQMRQLLQNLIGNALKFRRAEEPPVVKIAAELIPDPAAPDRKLCRLTVSDNGIGFEEKYVDRIFQVFQRLHTRSEYEGTGMGLAIVRKIALHHGGEITAKSTPGEGSTFILTIPASQPEAGKDNQANGTASQ